MELKHFAHEHTLIFEETEEIRHCCNACGVYVLLSPCYRCTTQGCNFYLHQACALLPSTLHHYYCRDQYYDIVKHDLALFAKPQDENCLCGKCEKLCEKFTYHCLECEFVLHPLCGVSLDIQIKHESHPQHPMSLVCNKAMFRCNVCRREDIMDYFFSCHKCNFWIHQECVLLPSFVDVEEHEHLLSLVYSPSSMSGFSFRYINICLICAKIVVMDFGFYCCFVCTRTSHVDCARSHMRDSGAIFHLPTEPNDMFPSSMIRTLVKERAVEEETSNMLEKYHAYSLVLINDTPLESVCNACIQPLSAPYYRSNSDQSNFNFLLHKFCVDLPPSIEDSVYELQATGKLVSPRLDEFFSLFRCYTCQKYCNGFGYQYNMVTVDDLECSFSPKAIKHISHKQHPLVLAAAQDAIQSWYSCCDKQSCSYGYHCGVCQFRIHTDCARLPEAVTHRFDKHPLTLTFTSSSQHHDEHFCEFCEEDIDSKYWFYHCAECDQSFHVDCIPSTGKFSKIKFGGTVKVPCHEDHPLTLARMLNCGSQTCGYCHQTVKGFEDGMALHCESCDFWIHFRCGCLSSGGVVSLPYLHMRKLKKFKL